MLAASGLRKSFVLQRDPLGRTQKTMTAVDHVDLEVRPGTTLALVGESGCGKSTTAELVLQLQEPDEGSVTLDGVELTGMGTRKLRAFRRRVQPVFQDPYSSLDPSQTIGAGLAESLRIHKLGTRSERTARARDVLDRVGLAPSGRVLDRYPGEFSGGQRQRIAIARALIVEPDYVVLDEAVSALDVSTQALVLALLDDLQRDRGLGYLFISHDLGVVRHIADDIAVMYLGRVVERGPAATVYEHPLHPYTSALLDAVPEPDPELQRRRRARRLAARGEPPDPAQRPSGCAFRTRCPYAQQRCEAEVPELRLVSGRSVACHFAETIGYADPSPLAAGTTQTGDGEPTR